MPGTILAALCTPVDETHSPSQELDSVFRVFRSMPVSQESHCTHIEGLGVGAGTLGDGVFGIGPKREQYLREVPTAVEILTASYQVIVTARASMV